MRLLFIGDIVGKPGRQAVRRYLAAHDQEYDMVIANGENVAGGKGLTAETAHELFDAGVDALTGGNHIWRHRGIEAIIDDERVIRPANYPPEADAPGRGLRVLNSRAGFPVAILNVLGRVFLDHYEDPYAWAEEMVEEARRRAAIVIVDFHAEATSEKMAMLRLLDGRVSAVVGTHTHVQTADAQLTECGTAYITDVGMSGAHDSILGVRNEIILRQLRSQMPVRHELAKADPRVSALAIEIEPLSGRAVAVDAIFDPPWTRQADCDEE